jgi:hypothetical protein
LTLRTSLRMPYLLTIMSESAGSGAHTLQQTITTSTSSYRPCPAARRDAALANTASTAEKMTSSASSRAARRLLSGGM